MGDIGQKISLTHDQVQQSIRRALDLLKDCCTDDQWENYAINGYVPVTGSRGGHYRLSQGCCCSVQPNGRVVEGYCIQFRRIREFFDTGVGLNSIYYIDLITATKLLIETDEGLFLNTANH